MTRSRSSHRHVVLVVIACSATPLGALATPYYVNNCGDDTNCNGQYAVCWSQGVSDCAKKTIQAGMNLGQNGDAVHVAPGTYSGDGNRDLQFPRIGTYFARAITVRCSGCAGDCVIDCEGSDPCEVDSLSQHRGFWFNRDQAGNGSVVEGFTIKNGCIASAPSNSYSYGGAILVDQSQPTIRRCIFEQNTANQGGAIAFVGDVFSLLQPVLEDCTIRAGNQAVSVGNGNGGGVAFFQHVDAVVRNCWIHGNTAAQRGGGMYWDPGSDPRIDGCVIENNTAGSGGGGVYISLKEAPNVEIQPAPRVVRSRIGPNNSTTSGNGGGIAVHGVLGDQARIWIENCTIIGNHADASFGGGVALTGPNPQWPAEQQTNYVNMVNCIIAGNSASSGGGVYVQVATPTILSNVTLMHNKALGTNGGSAIYFDGKSGSSVDNTILWYDVQSPAQAQVRIGDSSTNLLTVRYSDIQDALPAGVASENNIAVNPLFVDKDGADNDPATLLDNNYHLVSGSPCNDRGSVPLVPLDELDLDADSDIAEHVPFDREDRNRYADDPNAPNDGVNDPPAYWVDMGAFEYQAASTAANVVAWESRVYHDWSDGQDIALEINSACPPTEPDCTFSESRLSGVSRILLSFSAAIDPATAGTGSVVVCGNDVNGQPVNLSGIVTSTYVMNNNMNMEVCFAPKLPNYARYRVVLQGLLDSLGTPITSGTYRIFTSLFCDATKDRRVNATDVGAVRSLIGQGVTQSINHTRSDVDDDGDIDDPDVDLVRGEHGKDARSILDPVCP